MGANLGRYITDVRRKNKRGFTSEERKDAHGDKA